MATTLFPREIDVSKITYTELKELGNKGGKSTNILYDGRKFIIQTPEMYIPYGINVWTDEKTGAKKYDLNLSFRDHESNPKIKSFFEKMKEIEQKVLEDAVTNSLTWFKKK